MPGLPEEPLGGKIITLRASRNCSPAYSVLLRCSIERKVPGFLRGVPKGSRVNNLERHSRGRGLMNKATRTLWRLFSDITTAMPPPEPGNFREKSQTPQYATTQVSTNGDTRVYDYAHRHLGPLRSTIRSSVRKAMPVGPFDRYGFASSPPAVPAMTRCAQATPSANSLIKAAAVMVPAFRPPTFLMSAMSDLICFEYSLSSGNCQNFSPTSRPAEMISSISCWSVPSTAVLTSPRAMETAPVSVAMSMIFVAPSFFA